MDLQFGVRLAEVVRNGDEVVATAEDGRVWRADLAVAALGMVPETELAERAGLDVADGVVVDQRCHTSAPGISAAGDVTVQPHPLRGDRYRIEHLGNAQDQAVAAVRNLLGVPTPYTPVPWSASEQYGVRLQLCGWPAAADAYGERGCVVRGDMSTLDSPALFWNRDRLVGTACVGRPAEFEELRRIVANHPHADLDLLADPATGLAVVGR